MITQRQVDEVLAPLSDVELQEFMQLAEETKFKRGIYSRAKDNNNGGEIELHANMDASGHLRNPFLGKTCGIRNARRQGAQT